MRLRVYILWFLLFLLYSSTSFGQSRPDEKIINYIAYNKPLVQVLKDLSKISDVNLVYSESRIPGEKPVSINAKNEKLGSVLLVILDDFNISYQIVGDQLVLVKNTKESEKTSIIYGYVRDKKSGELLVGANVFLHDRSAGVGTNEYGFYSFKLDRKTHRIHFSYLGYESEIREIFLGKDTTMNIYLEPDGTLNEIVILDDLLEEEHETTASKQNLHIDKILSSNHLVGETDLFRYLSIQPGVATSADGIGGLNVRGGSADQNLVLLDGVPVYNTGHAMGIFSIFNSNTIKSAGFYKGGIPARYSGRLSSVIDVHTKDGNFKKFGGDVTLSTIALKATIEGPIVQDKSSFIVSYRRTFLDIWIKELTKFQNSGNDKQGFANYYFNDFNGKLNFQLGKRTRLLMNFFQSNDDFYSNTKTNVLTSLRDENDKSLNWGNRLYSLRLNSQVGKSLFSRFTAYQTGYKFTSYKNNLYENSKNGDTSIVFDAYLFQSDISEIGLRHEFDWSPSARHVIKFGVAYQKRSFEPKVVDVTENNFEVPKKIINIKDLENYTQNDRITGQEINAFIEDDMDLGDGVRINAGLNYGLIFTQNNKSYKSFQPRFALLANGENLNFKIGVSRMQQYLHLLTNNGLGLPTDIWVPTSDVLPPQTSWIFNTSFGYRLNNGFKFGSEVYYKKFSDISSFKEGGGLDINYNIDWQNNIPIGSGSAYGVEAYAEKVIGKTLFSLNYTYSISDREFLDLNNGNAFPFGFNRKHSYKVSLTHRLSDFSEFLVNWSYMSGNFYSQPVNTSVPIGSKPVVVYLEKNNATFPTFHRLDVGFSFYNSFKWGRAKFFIGVYNAYNRNNPFYSELVRNNQDQSKYEFRYFSLLPLLPTLSYSISF